MRVQQRGTLGRNVVAKIESRPTIEAVHERARVEVPDGAEPDTRHRRLEHTEAAENSELVRHGDTKTQRVDFLGVSVSLWLIHSVVSLML
jgi:hypothetical protein